jgi:hypothetical protein
VFAPLEVGSVEDVDGRCEGFSLADSENAVAEVDVDVVEGD